MKRTITKNLTIIFEGVEWVPGFQCGLKTLKTSFNPGDNVQVNLASSGIGVTFGQTKECWIYSKPKI